MFKSFATTYSDKILGFSRDIPTLKPEPITPAEREAIIQNIQYKLKVFNQQRYIDALMRNEIILVRVPKMIPCWSANVNGKVVTYVNLSRYTILDEKTKEIKTNINIRSILGMIAMGFAQRQCIINYDKIHGNVMLRAALMNCYNRIIVRNIDMLYAISSSPVHNKALSYLVNKFFLVNIFGMDVKAANLNNAAFNDGSRSTITFEAVNALVKDFPDEAFLNFNNFILALKEHFQLLKGIDTISMLKNIVVKLGEYSMLILENYPYLLGIILSVSLQANIVRDIRYSSIISDSDINKVVTQFFTSATH